ncbi:MAG: hypothetical protein JSR24_13730 [Proteobacteria bacterium]|nr:hypothetical protein [Pseudomonadota bacterium]
MDCRLFVRGSLSLSLLLGAAACANVPFADPQQDAMAKRFDRPGQNGGALYIYRSGIMGFARPIDINVAGGSNAELASNTYVRLEGPPGPVDVGCKVGDKQGGQQVMIEPGRTRFIEASMDVGLGLPGCRLTEVSPDEGQAAVRNARRVVQQTR